MTTATPPSTLFPYTTLFRSVEGDRIGALDTVEALLPPLSQLEEAAICRIDMEPDLEFSGEIGEFGEQIDRTSIRGTRCGADRDRDESSRAVGGDQLAEPIEIDA